MTRTRRGRSERQVKKGESPASGRGKSNQRIAGGKTSLNIKDFFVEICGVNCDDCFIRESMSKVRLNLVTSTPTTVRTKAKTTSCQRKDTAASLPQALSRKRGRTEGILGVKKNIGKNISSSTPVNRKSTKSLAMVSASTVIKAGGPQADDGHGQGPAPSLPPTPPSSETAASTSSGQDAGRRGSKRVTRSTVSMIPRQPPTPPLSPIAKRRRTTKIASTNTTTPKEKKLRRQSCSSVVLNDQKKASNPMDDTLDSGIDKMGNFSYCSPPTSPAEPTKKNLNKVDISVLEESLMAKNKAVEAKDALLSALLTNHKEGSSSANTSFCWDHSTAKEPVVVKMAWEHIVPNVESLYEQAKLDLSSSGSAEDKDTFRGLNNEVGIETGISNHLVHKYLHFLELAVGQNSVRAMRPFVIMTKPPKGRKIDHAITNEDFSSLVTSDMIQNCRMSFGLVVMNVGSELPHFTLLAIDNERLELRHFCSMLERLDSARLVNYLKSTFGLQYKHVEENDGPSAHHQDGTYDCGVFVCQNAKHLAFESQRDVISQANMEIFRKMMLVELLQNIVFTWK